MARKHGKLQYVKIQKDGVEGECLPQSVAAWERHGWTVVDDGTSEEADEVPFTPADSSVAEKNEEVAEEEPQLVSDEDNAKFLEEAQRQLDNKDKE